MVPSGFLYASVHALVSVLSRIQTCRPEPLLPVIVPMVDGTNELTFQTSALELPTFAQTLVRDVPLKKTACGFEPPFRYMATAPPYVVMVRLLPLSEKLGSSDLLALPFICD